MLDLRAILGAKPAPAHRIGRPGGAGNIGDAEKAPRGLLAIGHHVHARDPVAGAAPSGEAAEGGLDLVGLYHPHGRLRCRVEYASAPRHCESATAPVT